MSESLTDKQLQFNAAMARYEQLRGYRVVTMVVSFVNVSLQLLLIGLVLPQSIGLGLQLLAVVVAYALADFVNGWVHLYMDNSENYESLTGPFFAAFHLHHRTPRYRSRALMLVYYQEAGSKLWLAFVEIIMVLTIWPGIISGVFAYLMLYFAVLSTVAEVSHYLSHKPPTKLGRVLGRLRILLPNAYHARHHREDNVQYAFLNGMSDPLLDLIARRFYSGYKHTTDLHFATYGGADTKNR
jgi:hypothetical protein